MTKYFVKDSNDKTFQIHDADGWELYEGYLYFVSGKKTTKVFNKQAWKELEIRG